MKTRKGVPVETGLLIIVLLFAGCKKEYSYEGGVAVFSLLNANGSCTDPVLSGNYLLGSALDPSNTVQLQVDVTNIGRFSLQTNRRSGFLFSATGSFSDTGVQTVTLTAIGRPDSIGNFVFNPELPLSCAFNVEVTGQQVLKADYTLAGAPNSCSNIQVLGDYQKDRSLTSSNTVTVNVDVISPGDYMIHTDTLDGISFSASGHFTQVGPQQVILTGTGTPVNPQNLRFTTIGNGSACSFPLTVENPGNPATYVIESGINLCIGTLEGSYTAGTALSVFNTYTLSVYVTAPGNFTISTQTVNGVIFYYTGVFSSLGQQNVTLVGYGTPVSVGTFTLTPEIVGPHPLGGQVCDFSIDVK
jgi:hypothetical protein